jgi:hypothetical protein
MPMNQRQALHTEAATRFLMAMGLSRGYGSTLDDVQAGSPGWQVRKGEKTQIEVWEVKWTRHKI